MKHDARLGPLLVPADPEEPLARLIAALEDRGQAVRRSPASGTDGAGGTLVLGPDTRPAGTRVPDACGRILVVSLIGVHPDARSRLLRDLWDVEEWARAAGPPVLVVRLGPLVGPGSPLWSMLATRPRLPRDGAHLLCPVVEEDVVEGLDRALTGRVSWDGWYEACGPEPLTMAELVSLAAASEARGVPAAWEPDLDVLLEQRLAEHGPWCDHFGLDPIPLSRRIAEWAA